MRLRGRLRRVRNPRVDLCDRLAQSVSVSKLTYGLPPPFRNANQAFDRIPAEGPVLSADGQRLLIVFAIVPSLERVEAIPLLDSDALWWRSLKWDNRFRAGS